MMFLDEVISFLILNGLYDVSFLRKNKRAGTQRIKKYNLDESGTYQLHGRVCDSVPVEGENLNSTGPSRISELYLRVEKYPVHRNEVLGREHIVCLGQNQRLLRRKY